MLLKVVQHSSGLPILFSGSGYLAGSIGTPAIAVAVFPWVVGGAVAVGAGYLIYNQLKEGQ